MATLSYGGSVHLASTATALEFPSTMRSVCDGRALPDPLLASYSNRSSDSGSAPHCPTSDARWDSAWSAMSSNATVDRMGDRSALPLKFDRRESTLSIGVLL